jgi:hypothetical protein
MGRFPIRAILFDLLNSYLLNYYVYKRLQYAMRSAIIYKEIKKNDAEVSKWLRLSEYRKN